MLKTWTDTHYKLEDGDWLYLAKHDDQGAASLICPGYARDGSGFTIHFTPAHIEILQNLLAILQSNQTGVPSELSRGTPSHPWVDRYPHPDPIQAETHSVEAPGYKYPDSTPVLPRPVIR
jgi:hypothetical protein